MTMIKKPTLYIVIPCYNEENVLPITVPMFKKSLLDMIEHGKISDDSRVLFVNDGSVDNSWNIIKDYVSKDLYFKGVSLSRNRGHQNALLAGLMESKEFCDVTISIDCDGQDDIFAMEEMIDKWREGYEIVYGVRNNRDTDTIFKRITAQQYYKLLSKLGGGSCVQSC